MNLEEQAKQLHDRATRGETLSPAEQMVLQNWYDELDREEDLLINKNTNDSDVEGLREQLGELLTELARTASENERIARQNEIIRRENEKLRQTVESRLLERVA